MEKISTRFPSEGFGYLLGLELFRENEIHLVLPKQNEPQVRFPGLPPEFVQRLLREEEELDESDIPASPPELRFTTAITRLAPIYSEIFLYFLEDSSADWINELSEVNGIEQRVLRRSIDRALISQNIVCRQISIEAGKGMDLRYKIESNESPDPETYINEELPSL